jgi:hypothetical protein
MVMGVGMAQRKPVAIRAKAIILDTISGIIRITPAVKLLNTMVQKRKIASRDHPSV